MTDTTQPPPPAPSAAPAPEPVSTDMTPDEVFESLTGFEEIAIGERFGASVTKLIKDDNETIFVRSMLYTVLVRAGVSPHDARHEAMTTTLGQVKARFAEDPDDVLPDDPDSASGKGDSSPASSPTTSPPSASSPASSPASTRG